MKIEIDGIWYEWVPSVHDTFKVLEQDGSFVRLQVPAHADEAFVKSYIKTHGAELLQRQKSNVAENIEPVPIFGIPHFVHHQENCSHPYIKGFRIYLNTNDRQWNDRSINSLKKTLLLQLIIQLVGHWEEQLDLLSGEILIRKLRSNWYNTDKQSCNLTFDTALTDQPTDYITYIVVRALLTVQTSSKKEQEQQLDRLLPGWQEKEEALAYERTKFTDTDYH
ncbi:MULTISPECIES: YgjP-like metallopeptidase domain-containing protein [unclassified Sphingobacterium]|uniref:YgjP-like metallopeptidase domain-containing protein n=1 Tax=unclassified Sphingobacterium TaxID=2609468 RepID=UPI0025E67DCA|nr:MULTISPECIES: YgjP-like metallopeptidase domain-containing protein [unclassified Sphingobacterium]